MARGGTVNQAIRFLDKRITALEEAELARTSKFPNVISIYVDGSGQLRVKNDIINHLENDSKQLNDMRISYSVLKSVIDQIHYRIAILQEDEGSFCAANNNRDRIDELEKLLNDIS